MTNKYLINWKRLLFFSLFLFSFMSLASALDIGYQSKWPSINLTYTPISGTGGGGAPSNCSTGGNYGCLNTTNIWTGSNVFNLPVTFQNGTTSVRVEGHGISSTDGSDFLFKTDFNFSDGGWRFYDKNTFNFFSLFLNGVGFNSTAGGSVTPYLRVNNSEVCTAANGLCGSGSTFITDQTDNNLNTTATNVTFYTLITKNINSENVTLNGTLDGGFNIAARNFNGVTGTINLSDVGDINPTLSDPLLVNYINLGGNSVTNKFYTLNDSNNNVTILHNGTYRYSYGVTMYCDGTNEANPGSFDVMQFAVYNSRTGVIASSRRTTEWLGVIGNMYTSISGEAIQTNVRVGDKISLRGGADLFSGCNVQVVSPQTAFLIEFKGTNHTTT